MGTHALTRDGERYELLDELASGGMATVYLARMRRPMGFSRLVAIKCMHPQFAKDPSFVSMFMDEARLTARLRHPNIVPTLDIVADDGHLLLVMEYIEGASLATILRSVSDAGVRVPVPIACAIVHDLLLGLHAAHQAKDDEGAPLAIVHRDVSPQNVLVGLDGLSRVLDFGVARARQNTHQSNDNEIKGKIPYMPPEQLFGEALDHTVDVYSAGVTLWEALVCERLFDGPSETTLVKKISEEPIAKPSSRVGELSPELDAIVMRALARDAKDRYETALAMAEAIARIITLPTRTEVSAWVRQHVAPREIASSVVLPIAGAPTTRRTTILALLEKASALGPSAKRPARIGTVRNIAPPRATRFAIGVAAVAFAVAGVAIARVAKSEAATARLPTMVAAAVIEKPAPASPAMPASVAAAPLEAPKVDAPKVDAPKVDAPKVEEKAVRVVARPTRAPTAKAEPETKPPTEPGRSSACKIPYTIDGQGHKHYEIECM